MITGELLEALEPISGGGCIAKSGGGKAFIDIVRGEVVKLAVIKQDQVALPPSSINDMDHYGPGACLCHAPNVIRGLNDCTSGKVVVVSVAWALGSGLPAL